MNIVEETLKVCPVRNFGTIDGLAMYLSKITPSLFDDRVEALEASIKENDFTKFYQATEKMVLVWVQTMQIEKLQGIWLEARNKRRKAAGI